MIKALVIAAKVSHGEYTHATQIETAWPQTCDPPFTVSYVLRLLAYNTM